MTFELVDLQYANERANGTLVGEAYDRLKTDIITHRLQPGRKVSEAKLVAHSGLGRAPVRAAMARLAQEGLIITPSPKTNIVAPLTFADIKEVFHLRNLLEPDAARMATGRINIARLRKLNAACKTQYALGDADNEFAFLKANRDFHVYIAVAAGNPLQAQWIERLQDAVMRVLWLALRQSDTNFQWASGHNDIVEAMERGDGNAAERLARKHLLGGQDKIMRILLDSGQVDNINLAVNDMR